jgi:hypothetical protein
MSAARMARAVVAAAVVEAVAGEWIRNMSGFLRKGCGHELGRARKILA